MLSYALSIAMLNKVVKAIPFSGSILNSAPTGGNLTYKRTSAIPGNNDLSP